MFICIYMYTPHSGIMKTGKNGGDSYSAAIVTVPSVCQETGGKMKVTFSICICIYRCIYIS
jgi:hypothetical protein